jgi:RimJ/RimL family protein N-acetyltransferase
MIRKRIQNSPLHEAYLCPPDITYRTFNMNHSTTYIATVNYMLETERLRLRQFSLDDSAFIVRLLNSPGWLQFIGDRNVHTEEEAKTYLRKGPMASYEKNGFGLLLVERKEDKAPIGMCGLVKREGFDKPDIGFAFLPEFTGQGYAYEIAKAQMDYARQVLGLSTVLGITTPDNRSSIRLLEKIGLHFEKKFSFPDAKEELLLFSS